ncbi:MAG TPA: glycosyltransferase family 39 protein [Actinoplanes sp.]
MSTSTNRAGAPELPGPAGTAPQAGSAAGAARADRQPEADRQPPADRRWAVRPAWLWPALLTGAIAAEAMTAPQLWRDEFATWSAATRSLADLWRMAGTIDLVAFPYYVFMHAWIEAFGDSVWALRLPSVIAMAATAGVVTLLGRRLYGVRSGLLGGLLFAVVPSVSRYGQEARAYAFAMLFATLATLLLVLAVQDSRRWHRIAYSVVVLLLGWAHLIAVLVVTGHAVAVALAGRRSDDGGRPRPPQRDRRPGGDAARWWPAAVTAAGICLAPLALLGLRQRDTQLGWLTAAGWRALETLPEQLFGSGMVGGAVVALAAIGTRPGRAGPARATPGRAAPGRAGPERAGPERAGPPGRGWTTALWVSALAPVAVLYLVDQLIAPVFVGRYLLFVVPLLCVLAGTALASRGLPLALVVVLVIGLTGLPQQQAARRSHEAPGTALYDYRQVAAFLRDHQRPGDGIVYAPRGGWHLSDVAMRYYLGDAAPRDVLVDRDAVRRGSLWATECPDPAACLAGTGRVWVLSGDDLITGARARVLDGTSPATRAALGRYAKGGEWRLSKFTLALYAR